MKVWDNVGHDTISSRIFRMTPHISAVHITNAINTFPQALTSTEHSIHILRVIRRVGPVDNAGQHGDEVVSVRILSQGMFSYVHSPVAVPFTLELYQVTRPQQF